MTTTLIDRRALGWDVSLGGSHNSNKILALGNDASGKALPTIGTGGTRDSSGLPVNGTFERPFTYADLNGDGIITPNEVTVDSNTTPGTVNGFVYYRLFAAPRHLFDHERHRPVQPQTSPHRPDGLQGRVRLVQLDGPVLRVELPDLVLREPEIHVARRSGENGGEFEREESETRRPATTRMEPSGSSARCRRR